MKIIKLVKKDLKLFRRDTKTMALVLLTPLVILFILGNVFGQSANSKSITGIKIGLCNVDERQHPINLPLFSITNLGSDCEYQSKELVSKGKMRAAVLIPKNFSRNIEDGVGTEITLYVDNSKTQTAIMASESIKALVQDQNEKIGTSFINEAWQRLKNLNEKLKIALSEISIAKDKALDVQESISSLSRNMGKIDGAKLDSQILKINSTVIDLNGLQSDIDKELQDQISLLGSIHYSGCPGNFSGRECEKINLTLSRLKNLQIKLSEQAKIILSLNNLNLTQISSQFSSVNKSRDQLKSDLIIINSTVFNYTGSLISSVDELNQTTRLLDLYTSKDPKNIVRAVTLNEEKVFGERTYFEFLSSGLMMTLLLFTTILVASSNLVYERKTGTMARTLLSPTAIPTFLIGKLIVFVILAIVEIAVMLLTIGLFNISITLSLSLWLILLISAVNFIFIGLLIGAISNSENTALLSSLVIVLPMFFLSNLFFPFEVMPKLMKEIGSNLPLTLSVGSLDQILTYSNNLDINSLAKLVLIAVVLSIITYLIIKKKPTSE